MPIPFDTLQNIDQVFIECNQENIKRERVKKNIKFELFYKCNNSTKKKFSITY